MSNESYLLLITYYFAREVRALGEFNLPSSIPSLMREKCGQYAWVKHLFLVSASRQLLQVGEPQGRTGNSIALAVPCGQPLCVYVKKLTLVTEF
jgi:hypothetical protein